MKKAVTAMVLVISLALCLAGCSSGEAATVSDDAADQEMPEIPLAQGETTVNVGDFTVTVPEGWLGAGDIDYDEQGNYQMSANYYYLIKGGESAEDEFVKPTLSIYYTPERSAQELLDLNISEEDENTELDITVGGKKCPAYHAVMSYSGEDTDPLVMEYDNIFIPVTDNSCLRVSMLTFMTNEGDSGISASDEDVIAIMESLRVN